MRVLILDFFSLLMAFSCVFHLNAQYHFDIELLKTGKIIPASSINTSANESSPILDNEKIYFISDRNDTPFDVYTAQYVKGIITDITLLGGKMNSSQHEGPICRCNGKLYFSRSVQKSINGVKTDGVQLMVEERGKVKALNSTKNLMHMYAVEIKSNRTTDIVKIDETGKIIADESLNILNSNSNDAFPSLIHDSLMVFASKRPGGYGGFDLYFSFMKNNQWSSPKLLPPPFNTPFDDVSLTMFSDGRTGMISSNRPGGKGGDDIYFWAVDQPIIQYTKPIEMATFELVLTDKLTSDPVVGSFVKLYKVLDDKSLETLRRLKIDNFESNDSVAPKTIAYYVDPSPILLKSNDVGSVKTSL
ncbi:MAG TPA: hypothetical protein PKD85_07350, partial [Saprospiraceae bacterium]|nr:hypothetical protein [Saprospiraceae bacterium]